MVPNLGTRPGILRWGLVGCVDPDIWLVLYFIESLPSNEI